MKPYVFKKENAYTYSMLKSENSAYITCDRNQN